MPVYHEVTVRPMSDDASPNAQAGRAPRHRVMLSAIVERFGGGEPSRHRVRDLSTAGVRIDRVVDLPVGATVLVSVGRLQAVGATVVWVKDGSAGLKFAHNIDVDDARANAVIAPQPTNNKTRDPIRAGWIPDLKSPYRK